MLKQYSTLFWGDYSSIRGIGTITLTLQVLLLNGALVNSPDGEGKTALHHALSQDSTSITRLLLDHGADPDMTSHHGVAARSLAGPNTVNLLVERPRSAEKLSTEKAFLDASKVTNQTTQGFVSIIFSQFK